MQASIEASEGFNRKIKVVVPAAEFKKAHRSTVNKFNKNRRIPGFRPGKAPESVILQNYGYDIYNEVTNNLINSTLAQALEQCELKDLANSMPVISDVKPASEDSDFEYVAEFEVAAKISFEDKKVSDVEFTKINGEITDADVDQMIEVLRKQQGKWEDAGEAACGEGDLATVNFEGFIDGVAFEGGKADNYGIVIGQTPMIPGFVDQIKGHKANDEFDINVTFPEQYKAELAGKPAVFKCKVVKVSKLALPEIDATFLANLGAENKSIEEFKDEVRKNMQRELEMNVDSANEAEVFEKLFENFAKDLELPPRQVAEVADGIKKQAAERKQTISDEVATENAKTQIKSSMIFGSILEELKVEVAPNAIEEYVGRIASAYEASEEFKKAILKDQQQVQKLYHKCLVNAFTNKCFEVGKTNETTKSFYEVVKNPF